MILEVDKKFFIIKHLIEHAEEIARGKCFYSESVDELMESLDNLKHSLVACRIPKDK